MSKTLSAFQRLATEELLSLAQAPKYIPTPNGRRKVHYATIYRWATVGLRGIKLETVKVGQNRYTTVEAISRFLEATAEEVA